MSSRNHLRMRLVGLGVLLCVSSAWAANWNTFMLTDVIPFNLSAETDQNSEPSIAASPCTAAPNDGILISAFANNLNNPFFGSGNGGITYANVFNRAAGDITLKWNGNGVVPTAYLVRLYNPGTGGYQIAVEKSATCLGNPPLPLR